MGGKFKHKMRQLAQRTEKQRFGLELNIDEDDVEFICQQVWRLRCAVSNKRLGGQVTPTLTRWYTDEPSTPYNLVLMLKEHAEAFASQGPAAFDKATQEKIVQRMEWAKQVCIDSWEAVDGHTVKSKESDIVVTARTRELYSKEMSTRQMTG